MKRSSKVNETVLKTLVSALIAAAIMLCGCVNASALQTSSGVCGDGLFWSVDDAGSLVISGTGEMSDYDAENPAPWSGNELTSAVVESGVTGIGDYAFAYCGGLKTLVLPAGLTRIGAMAFSDCVGITSLIIPESVDSIGSNAFFGCDNVTLYVYKESYAHLYAQMKRMAHKVISRGDYDGDGRITVADALAALRVAAELAPETPEAIAIGDADGDGRITVSDALAVLRVAAKLKDSL